MTWLWLLFGGLSLGFVLWIAWNVIDEVLR